MLRKGPKEMRVIPTTQPPSLMRDSSCCLGAFFLSRTNFFKRKKKYAGAWEWSLKIFEGNWGLPHRYRYAWNLGGLWRELLIWCIFSLRKMTENLREKFYFEHSDNTENQNSLQKRIVLEMDIYSHSGFWIQRKFTINNNHGDLEKWCRESRQLKFCCWI